MGALNSLATIGLDLAQARERQKGEAKQLEGERTRRARDLLAQAGETRRLDGQTLARRLAEERARAGAATGSATGGSIDAVLGGLTAADRAEAAALEGDLRARLAALDAGYDARSRKSLLDYDRTLISGGSRLGALAGRRSLLE